MKERRILSISLSIVFLFALAIWVSRAQGPAPQGLQGRAQPQAALGSAFTYQGQLKKDGSLVDASCQMTFGLYDQATGGNLVAGPLTQTVSVAGGLFTVKLDFGRGPFAGEERWLGVQVQCPGDVGYADLGRQELTAAPYALYAPGSPYQNVIVVAKSGGDYTSVQAALDSIVDAAADNSYLVWIAPGVYSETVVMKPYVHLQGAGQEATIITSTVGNGAWPPTVGTLMLAANTSVRDLAIWNGGVSAYNTALLALDGATQTLAADVTVLAQGTATGVNMAICQTGANTGLTLINVTALAENASTTNCGLNTYQGRAITLHGGSFTGRGGSDAVGLYILGAGDRLDAWGVTFLAENGTTNRGLFNYGAVVALHGGSFSARGGGDTHGIFNYGDTAVLDAEAIVALGENASGYNRGLYDGQGATALLHGGSFTGRGAGTTHGIYNNDSGLIAESITALGEGGDDNSGLCNYSLATATLHGGSFTARNGSLAKGIQNDQTSGLEADNTGALAENATTNYGLYNDNSATATLRGGSFIARGGTTTRGIYTHSDNAYLEADNTSILGEGGSTTNRGLESSVGADALVTQSVLEGASNSVVTTGGGGPVTLSNSRLVGGPAQGVVSCTAVSRDTTFNASGCP